MERWSDGFYEGPRVRPTAAARQVLRSRMQSWVAGRVEDLYDAALAEWANADSGRFPERGALEQQARREIETLCRALGPWAVVKPEVLKMDDPYPGCY